MNMHFLCILNAPNRFIIIQETQYQDFLLLKYKITFVTTLHFSKRYCLFSSLILKYICAQLVQYMHYLYCYMHTCTHIHLKSVPTH